MEDRPSRPMKSGGRLERVLLANEFAVTAEVVPPASPDPSGLIASARRLKGYADAFNVTDSPRAHVHMASWAGAALLLREGLEPVMQIVTRDRNRIALQADVLGASALGVRNVMALSGDDAKAGNEPGATAIFDLDTEGFIEALRDLRDKGVLHGGDAVDPRPPPFIRADAKAEGLAIAVEAVEALRKVEGVRGVHLMAVNWEESVPAIVRRAGLLPRPDA